MKERAQARWNALVQGDCKTAYDYLSPGSRAVAELRRITCSSLRKGFWKAATVDKVDVRRPQRCEVEASRSNTSSEGGGRRPRSGRPGSREGTELVVRR